MRDPGKLRLFEDAVDWQPRTGTSQSRSFRKLARLTGTDGCKFLQGLGAGPSIGVWPWWPCGGPACGVGPVVVLWGCLGAAGRGFPDLFRHATRGRGCRRLTLSSSLPAARSAR